MPEPCRGNSDVHDLESDGHQANLPEESAPSGTVAGPGIEAGGGQTGEKAGRQLGNQEGGIEAGAMPV